MKKIIAILFIVSIAIGLCACGSTFTTSDRNTFELKDVMYVGPDSAEGFAVYFRPLAETSIVCPLKDRERFTRAMRKFYGYN